MAVDHRENVTLGTGEVVCGDRPCLTCGYNLRTLPLAGQCPECGTPVAVTPATANLLAAPRDHLQWLRVGAVLMLIAVVAFGAAVLAVAGMMLCDQDQIPAFLPISTVAALGLAALACITGLALLTRRGPCDPEDRSCANLRRTLWVVVVAFQCALAAAYVGTEAMLGIICLAILVLLVALLVLSFLVVHVVARLLTQLGRPLTARGVELLYPGQPLLALALIMTVALAGHEGALALLPCVVLLSWAAAWFWAFSKLGAALGKVACTHELRTNKWK